MGTKGLFGFYKNTINKITYIPLDANPECLGQNLINFIQNTTTKNLNNIFDKIQMKKANEMHNELRELSDIVAMGNGGMININKYFDDKIINANSNDNFNLLFDQEKIEFIDDSDFINNSAYCQWAYIINLDENVFEIYQGGQLKPHINRYCKNHKPLIRKDIKIYSCKLIYKFDLNNIPVNWKEIVYEKENCL